MCNDHDQSTTVDTAMAQSYQDYATDVLQLVGQSEDELDAALRLQAGHLGLQTKPQPSTPPISEQSSRYSTSVDSCISVSTGWSGASIYSHDTRRSTTSSFSTGSSRSHKSALSRIKGLGMLLRPSRSELKGCPHCPKDAASQRRALHELPCGHRLCTQALRSLVIESIRDDTAPLCCSMPIPERFVRHVLTDEEVKTCQQRAKTADVSPVPNTENTLHDTVAPQHQAEATRFDVWAAKVRSAMQSQRVELLKVLDAQHLKALDEQAEAQATDMSIAEDRQVKAEADLRQLQEQDIKDNATALKHMEAFCAGTTASGESHNRVITEQDMNELRKTQAARDAMEQKHTSAINILRGEQTRRMKLRAQRHDKDRHQLAAAHRREVMALEQRYRTEETSLSEECSKRRQRMEARWKLQTLIEEKKAERATLTNSTNSSAEHTSNTVAPQQMSLTEFLAGSAATA